MMPLVSDKIPLLESHKISNRPFQIRKLASVQILFLIVFSIVIYQELQKIVSKLETLSETIDSRDFYRSVKEEAHCNKKVRIGEAGDGGKYVCNPGKAKKNCTLMSLGLNNQIQYDVDIFNATGGNCKSLGADKDPQNKNTQAKYEKINGKLFSGLIPDELSIPSMLRESGRSEVELLKIDIEGGEVTGLEPLLKDYYVCQIFIELHGAPLIHLEMLQMMARYGFRIFNVEPNPYCVKCCEYSLINEKCMEQFEVVTIL